MTHPMKAILVLTMETPTASPTIAEVEEFIARAKAQGADPERDRFAASPTAMVIHVPREI